MKPPSAPSSAQIAPALVGWGQVHGRHDLPWQREPTPYRVWVSEVMLQQTQVATVLPYYQRFLARFPDVKALAAASLDEVLSLWTGLGYYARACNLHRAARIVVERHNGCLPDDLAQLQKLPGIGRSTASAILALAHSQRHPILDANARRVLARYFGVAGEPATSDTQRRLWSLAEACTPFAGVAAYTQAIMDLGASICRRSRPACEACPLAEGCLARQAGRQHELPARRHKPARPQRRAYALAALDREGALLLEQRPARGVWGSLWSLPMFDTEAEAWAWCEANLAGLGATELLPAQEHDFTHYHLTLYLLTVRLGDQCAPSVAQHRWFLPRELANVGISKAVTRLLPELEGVRGRKTLMVDPQHAGGLPSSPLSTTR